MRLVSQSSVRRQLEPGDRVGDHLIIRSVLGKGGTAVVFEALHTRLSSLVALKVVEVHASFARDAAARLEREALVCAAIDDPHIPKIYDVGQLDDGTPYIVMEKIAGPTLEHMLEDGAIRPRIALSIVRDLLSALGAVHQAGVVHRDVKPSNLIVQTAEDGAHRVRLMDFGVSKSMNQHRSDPAITHQGALVGTPHYMAPEQVSDEGVDGRTDVYAAGVLLYELLAGQVPFDGGSSAEVMTAVLRHAYRPLHAYCPKAPKALSALVDRAMAERPEDRFASAREMRDALDHVIAAMDAKAQAPHKAHALLPSRNTAAWSALSVMFAFLLAVGSRQVTRSGAAEHASMPVAASTTSAPETAAPAPAASTIKAAESSSPARAVSPAQATLESSPHSSPRHAPSPARLLAVRSAAAKGSFEKSAPRSSMGTPPSEAPPATPSILVSDYVRQLEGLGRAVSEAARSLEEPGPLPDNPYL